MELVELGKNIAQRMRETGKTIEELYAEDRPTVSMGVRQAELAKWREALDLAREV